MNFTDVDFARGLARCGERTDQMECVAMAGRLEVILQRLAANRDAFFEDDPACCLRWRSSCRSARHRTRPPALRGFWG